MNLRVGSSSSKPFDGSMCKKVVDIYGEESQKDVEMYARPHIIVLPIDKAPKNTLLKVPCLFLPQIMSADVVV